MEGNDWHIGDQHMKLIQKTDISSNHHDKKFFLWTSIVHNKRDIVW